MSKYPPKKPQRSGSLMSLGDVIPAVYQNLDMDKKVNEFAVLSLWPQALTGVLGVDIAMQTQAVKLRQAAGKMVLHVKVSSAPMASEISFYTSTLLQTLNAYAPQTGIKIDRIELRVGAVNLRS